MTDGVDASSGQLGQGIGQEVGMAPAERIFSHYTYCLCDECCLNEGISQEAISLTGLHKLRIYINKITFVFVLSIKVILCIMYKR